MEVYEMTGLAHKDDEYETPPWLLDEIKLKSRLDFKLDVAATFSNKKCKYYMEDALNDDWITPEYMFERHPLDIFVNPPRSKNGRFVRKLYEQWEKFGMNIVILLTWNDFGNKYGQECVINPIKTGKHIEIHNLGKIKFYKDGVESKHVSRLNYCWVWYKGHGNLKPSFATQAMNITNLIYEPDH